MVSSVTNASKNITRHKRKKPEPIKRIQLFFVVVVDFFMISALVTSYGIFFFTINYRIPIRRKIALVSMDANPEAW